MPSAGKQPFEKSEAVSQVQDASPQPLNEEQARLASEYAQQAERLGYRHAPVTDVREIINEAVGARFVTGQDPVIETTSGARLPAVPVPEALKLNALRDRMQGKDPSQRSPIEVGVREARGGAIHGAQPSTKTLQASKPNTALYANSAPAFTNPLFPPLPMYGPPSLMRNLQCLCFRVSSLFLSTCFLIVIILGLVFTSVPDILKWFWQVLTFQDRLKGRPFHQLEKDRKTKRREAEAVWEAQAKRRKRRLSGSQHEEHGEADFRPLEGGPDPLVCDPAYYARRVGLDMESFEVTTEDGFKIELYHILDPRSEDSSEPRRPNSTSTSVSLDSRQPPRSRTPNLMDGSDGRKLDKKYPVLLMHGLLQSAGAFCTNDEDSLAFFLAKSGYDVWLGNNRCGFNPKHTLLTYSDPRMWAWNIRQMGVMDLPALIQKVLSETGFPKLGLICHSQGTTQTFVALAKEQRPDIGEKISVFCALAPAVYAGPLISKIYFKIMRVISPALFRMVFGIHAFIPLMPKMHVLLPPRIYGFLGYHVFRFLFNWTDLRWEKDLRDRLFQWAPSYVSAESMRWWLGRECFAKHRCILATRSEGHLEDEEDKEEDDYFNLVPNAQSAAELSCHCTGHYHREHGRYAWYDERAPPMAFWIAGNDDLVDGRRLLKRFERGREPHVDLVHQSVIEGYEHLDVIWAMDSIDKVGKEVREVVWRTAPSESRQVCRMPVGCEGVPQRRPSRRAHEEDLIDFADDETVTVTPPPP